MNHTQHISTGVIAPAGNEILAMIKSVEGQTWVAIKPLCQKLKIDWAAQFTKLSNNPRFNCCDIAMVGADGRTRVMTCLPSDQVVDWVNSINSAKVTEEKRDSLMELQKFFQQGLHNLARGNYVSKVDFDNLQRVVSLLLAKIEVLEHSNIRASQLRGSEAAYGMLARKHEKRTLIASNVF